MFPDNGDGRKKRKGEIPMFRLTQMLHNLIFYIRILFRLIAFRIAPPRPAFGGGDDDPGTAEPGKETPPGGKKESDPAPEPSPVSFSAEQQTAIDAIIQKRLDRGKAQWEAEQAQAKTKAEETAEAKRLADQQQFKELAEKHEGKVKELEPFKAKAEKQETALKAILEKERKGREEGVLALLDRLDPTEQLEWLAANPLPEDEGKQKPPNTNAGNRSNGTAKTSKEERRKQLSKRFPSLRNSV